MGMRTQIVALNNIGVSLMRKNCFAQAEKTFEAAVQLMQNKVINTDVDYLLQAANKRLCRPRPMTNINIKVKDQNDCQDLLDERYGSSSFFSQTATIYALTIDDLEEETTRSINGPSIEIACLLHNYGLSLLCLSQFQGSELNINPSLAAYMQALQDQSVIFLENALAIFEMHAQEFGRFIWYGLKQLSIMHSLHAVVSLRLHANQSQPRSVLVESLITKYQERFLSEKLSLIANMIK